MVFWESFRSDASKYARIPLLYVETYIQRSAGVLNTDRVTKLRKFDESRGNQIG